MKMEMRMISKDGTIFEFPGYISSMEDKEEEDKEEKEEKEKEESKKKYRLTINILDEGKRAGISNVAKSSPNIVEHPITELVEFVSTHQSLSLVLFYTDAKLGISGKVIVGFLEVIVVIVGVCCCRRGLKNGGGGGVVVVKPDVISEVAVTWGAEVSIKDAISLFARDGFSRFRNLLVKSGETEELCTGSLAFCKPGTEVRVT
nr:hypothetical protein [Tanacetum cinerariifolium]